MFGTLHATDLCVEMYYSPVDDNDEQLVPLWPPLPRRRGGAVVPPPVVGGEGGGDGEGGQGEAGRDQAPTHAGSFGEQRTPFSPSERITAAAVASSRPILQRNG